MEISTTRSNYDWYDYRNRAQKHNNIITGNCSPHTILITAVLQVLSKRRGKNNNIDKSSLVVCSFGRKERALIVEAFTSFVKAAFVLSGHFTNCNQLFVSS